MSPRNKFKEAMKGLFRLIITPCHILHCAATGGVTEAEKEGLSWSVDRMCEFLSPAGSKSIDKGTLLAQLSTVFNYGDSIGLLTRQSF